MRYGDRFNNIWDIVQCDPIISMSPKSAGLILKCLYRWRLSAISEYSFNASRPKESDRHFTDDIFNGIFLKTFLHLSQILLHFVRKSLINNKLALVRLMVGAEPLLRMDDRLWMMAQFTPQLVISFIFKIKVFVFHFPGLDLVTHAGLWCSQKTKTYEKIDSVTKKESDFCCCCCNNLGG